MRGPERASPFWVLKAVVRAVMMFAGFGGVDAAASLVAIFMTRSSSLCSRYQGVLQA